MDIACFHVTSQSADPTTRRLDMGGKSAAAHYGGDRRFSDFLAFRSDFSDITADREVLRSLQM